MRIWVVGNTEAVLGFALAGVGGRPVRSQAEALSALDEALHMPDAGIVLVTKDIARMIQARMDELKLRGTLPLFVEIPSPGGTPQGELSLGEMVMRAIGIRL